MRTRTAPIDVADAIEWGHSDNAGLACLLASPAGTGGGAGPVLRDLTGKTAGATLQGGAAWAGTPYGQGVKLNGAGENQYAAVVVPQSEEILYAAWVRRSSDVSVANCAIASQSNGSGGFFLYTGSAGGTISVDVPYMNDGILVTAAVDTTYFRRIGFCRSGSVGAWSYGLWVDGVRVAASTTANYHSTGTAPINLSRYVGGQYGATHQSLIHLHTVSPADTVGWFARDYEWSRDPATDPRLRRTSTRSLFGVSGGAPSFAFVPAFAPGWGW